MNARSALKKYKNITCKHTHFSELARGIWGLIAKPVCLVRVYPAVICRSGVGLLFWQMVKRAGALRSAIHCVR